MPLLPINICDMPREETATVKAPLEHLCRHRFVVVVEVAVSLPYQWVNNQPTTSTGCCSYSAPPPQAGLFAAQFGYPGKNRYTHDRQIFIRSQFVSVIWEEKVFILTTFFSVNTPKVIITSDSHSKYNPAGYFPCRYLSFLAFGCFTLSAHEKNSMNLS